MAYTYVVKDVTELEAYIEALAEPLVAMAAVNDTNRKFALVHGTLP